ncbi:MAG: hypothetical protein RBS80_15540 [Thermoguttaceae bacterium]|jgi:hypothetical protein|nr:hypothetical protein [Thermoguttaceae bacterium]
MRTHGTLVAWTCLLLLGCTGGSQEGVGLDDLEEFGRLPYLSATRDPQLADELARIVEEGGTPEQLTPADDERSAGDALKELFPEDRLDALVAHSDELVPSGEFRFDPVRLQHAIAFRRKYDRERLEAREALKQPQQHLGIRYVAGFSADMSVIEAIRLCARLEAFHAAELLAENDLDGAIGAVMAMLALTQCLATEKHLDARLHAAYLHTEALAAMQAIVTHADVAREHVKTLLQAVRDRLDRWPDDADAWIGERAVGLHAYELVREGALLILLTEEEIEEFKRNGDLRVIAAAARRNADRDQLYYLDTMRDLIEACRKPYYTRLPLLASIDQQLQERWGTPEYPFVAGRVLLKDLAAGHAIQARDRANWEAWSLALAVATGESPPKLNNPLTGKPYDVAREDTLIVVSGIGAGRDADRLRVYVPDFSKPPPDGGR